MICAVGQRKDRKRTVGVDVKDLQHSFIENIETVTASTQTVSGPLVRGVGAGSERAKLDVGSLEEAVAGS